MTKYGFRKVERNQQRLISMSELLKLRFIFQLLFDGYQLLSVFLIF